MKYFLFSDTHGLDLDVIKTKLLSKGYDQNNNDHTIVLAGDISDGYNDEANIIDWLLQVKNKIVIKGNHDLGDSNTKWWDNQDYTKHLNEKQKEYLLSLPFQLDTKDFKIAHGMYLENLGKYTEQASVWASPVLLNHNSDKWLWVDPETSSRIKERYDDSIEEYAASIVKPLFLGHFDEKALLRYAEGQDYKLSINHQGFYQYKNIIWLDKRVVDNKDNFDVYVWEVK